MKKISKEYAICPRCKKHKLIKEDFYQNKSWCKKCSKSYKAPQKKQVKDKPRMDGKCIACTNLGEDCEHHRQPKAPLGISSGWIKEEPKEVECPLCLEEDGCAKHSRTNPHIEHMGWRLDLEDGKTYCSCGGCVSDWGKESSTPTSPPGGEWKKKFKKRYPDLHAGYSLTHCYPLQDDIIKFITNLLKEEITKAKEEGYKAGVKDTEDKVNVMQEAGEASNKAQRDTIEKAIREEEKKRIIEKIIINIILDESNGLQNWQANELTNRIKELLKAN